MTLPDLPEPWTLTHLILLDPDWQANIRGEEHISVGTGDTPSEAIANALALAEEGIFVGRLFSLDRLEPAKADGLGLLALLNLTPPKPLPRRKINAL